MDTAQLKKEYKEKIAPALQKQFNYTSAMQIPVLKKIVINQGLGDATQDKKIIDVAINEISTIAGQKAVATYSKKDIANFKLRKKMPIGVMVTLRRERMYEFLERLVRVALPSSFLQGITQASLGFCSCFVRRLALPSAHERQGERKQCHCGDPCRQPLIG